MYKIYASMYPHNIAGPMIRVNIFTNNNRYNNTNKLFYYQLYFTTVLVK